MSSFGKKNKSSHGFSVVATPDPSTPSFFKLPRPQMPTPTSTSSLGRGGAASSSRFGQYVNAALQQRLQKNAKQQRSTESRASIDSSFSPISFASSVDLTQTHTSSGVEQVLADSAIKAREQIRETERQAKALPASRRERVQFAVSREAPRSVFARPPDTPQSFGGASNATRTPSMRRSGRATPSSKRKNMSTRTPATLTSAGLGNSNSSERSQIVISLVNLRGKGLVGVAAFDFSRANITLYQYRDTITFSNTLRLLSKYDPVQILLSETSASSPLAQAVQSEFEATPCESISRKMFSENKGLAFLKAYGTQLETISIDNTKYLCLACVSALGTWIENTQNVTFAQKSIPVQFKSLDGHMLLDYNTVRNLEIVYSLNSEVTSTGAGGGSIKKKKQTLLAVMNHCNTPGGQRQLRSNLLEPLTDIMTLNARYELVQQLLGDEDKFFDLNKLLSSLTLADRMCGLFAYMKKDQSARQCSQTIMNILVLKGLLQTLPKLAVALSDYTSPLVADMTSHFSSEKAATLLTAICEKIEPNAALGNASDHIIARNQIAFALKTGVNGYLDVCRASYLEDTEGIQQEVSGLREKLQVSALKIKYTPQRMYHIVMPRVWYEGNHEKLKDPDREEAPLFIDVVVKRKTVACTTSHLASLNARQDEAYCDIVTITERIIQSLLQTIRSNIMWLFQVSESIGFLDLMLCFANLVVLNPDYCMPQLTTEGPIAIKGGRHPIIENTRIASGSSLRFVPNDCFLTVESGHRLHIISGPNGAGKSVYIKTVGTLVIMAMCGSFIPASFASLRVTDAVMTRLNMTTSLESNRGSFCEELRETKAILQSLETSKSPLILIDELGRGTSTVDGLGIAWSVCEQLIQSSALSLFVSHYAELAQLESLYHHVKLSHMAVVEDQEAKRLGFLHELRDGYTPEATRHYGIYTAGLTGIPKRVLQAAMKIARTLAANTERLQEAQPIPVSRTYCSLFSMLKLLKNQLQQDRSQLAGAVSSPADDLRDPQDPAQQRQASPVAQTTMEYIQSLATKYLSM